MELDLTDRRVGLKVWHLISKIQRHFALQFSQLRSVNTIWHNFQLKGNNLSMLASF